MGIGLDDLLNPAKLIEDGASMLGVGGSSSASGSSATQSSSPLGDIGSMLDAGGLLKQVEKLFGGSGSDSGGTVEDFSGSMPDSLKSAFGKVAGNGYASDDSDGDDSVDGASTDSSDVSGDNTMGEED